MGMDIRVSPAGGFGNSLLQTTTYQVEAIASRARANNHNLTRVAGRLSSSPRLTSQPPSTLRATPATSATSLIFNHSNSTALNFKYFFLPLNMHSRV